MARRVTCLLQHVDHEHCVGQLGEVPLAHFWLLPEGVAHAGLVGGVGRVEGVKGLQEPKRPAKQQGFRA